MLIMVSPGLGATDSRRRGSRRAAHRPLLPTCCSDVAGIAPAGRHKHKGPENLKLSQSEKSSLHRFFFQYVSLRSTHPPDALSLQEKRETESVMKEGRTHMRRGKKKTLRHPTWPRTEGARRARERGGVGKLRCMICCGNIVKMQW